MIARASSGTVRAIRMLVLTETAISRIAVVKPVTLTALLAVLALTALLAVASGCDAIAPGSDECAGKCDDPQSAAAIICGKREAATGELGCTRSSADNIGIDPSAAAVRDVTIYVARRNLPDPLRVVVYDGTRIVRRLSVPQSSTTGVSSVRWNGRDDDGNLANGAIHRLEIERLSGSELDPVDTLDSNEHRIFTLTSLTDVGPGHDHPLGTDKRNSDDWGRVHVIRALESIGDAWAGAHKIAYLDLSSQNGGEFVPHTYHRDGDCVDIRYLRSDGPGPLDVTQSKRLYDREASQDLVDALAAAGAIEIFVDAKADLRGERLVQVGGHGNHLHAGFAKEPNSANRPRAINEGFVGGPCFDDSDCPLRNGFCLTDGTTVGVCTKACKGKCSDFVGGIYTLSECVRIDNQPLCMPARDHQRYDETNGCRADLSPASLASEDHNNALTNVCVP